MYETWGADADDWETRECSDDELIGVLYSVRSHPLTIFWSRVSTLGHLVCYYSTSEMVHQWALFILQDESSAESVAQNVLSIALALLLCLAVGNVVWRIVVVSWALLSAAVRYTTVALILLSIAAFLA